MEPRISVLYDGACGFCRRSVRVLFALDWLHQLRPVDFRAEQERNRWAPEIPFEDLDRALHVKFPNGKTLHGFRAFRALAWHLPLLWLIAPFLYLPGARPIGDVIYARIAERRKKCTHESCPN